MSILALCKQRTLLLQIAAASDRAGLDWRVPQTSPDKMVSEVAAQQPRIALITHEYLNQPGLFSQLRTISPQTLLILCLPSSVALTPTLKATLDMMDFDLLCTVDELTDCIVSVQSGRFFHSVLLKITQAAVQEMLTGWNELSPAERRVLRRVAEGMTGPQVADALCISIKTVNNHKLKIGQKLNIMGGPGSLNRFVLTHRALILKLLE